MQKLDVNKVRAFQKRKRKAKAPSSRSRTINEMQSATYQERSDLNIRQTHGNGKKNGCEDELFHESYRRITEGNSFYQC